ncbi:MAG: hypothetical protein ACRDHE_04480 [Ktedonobacterales bacterium]
MGAPLRAIGMIALGLLIFSLSAGNWRRGYIQIGRWGSDKKVYRRDDPFTFWFQVIVIMLFCAILVAYGLVKLGGLLS